MSWWPKVAHSELQVTWRRSAAGGEVAATSFATFNYICTFMTRIFVTFYKDTNIHMPMLVRHLPRCHLVDLTSASNHGVVLAYSCSCVIIFCNDSLFFTLPIPWLDSLFSDCFVYPSNVNMCPPCRCSYPCISPSRFHLKFQTSFL